MPQLRVFLSSTAYDLGLLRGQLKSFIKSLGHEVVLSEFSDVLYDPSLHTQTSCVQELKTCDAVVLVVGSRWGSQAKPEFIDEIDPSKLGSEKMDDVSEMLDSGNVSVTQLEAFTAFAESIPVFVFVDDAVMAESRFFEANRAMAEKGLVLPVLGDLKAAQYIFNFLNYVQSRTTGNAVVTFSQIEDIQAHLRSQWSAWLQRLLNDAKGIESRRTLMEAFNERFDDLQAALVSSISDQTARRVAMGVANFRLLSDFLALIDPSGQVAREESSPDFRDVLGRCGVVEVSPIPESLADGMVRGTWVLLADGRVLRTRIAYRRVEALASDWVEFVELNEDLRKVVLEAIRANGPSLALGREEKLTEKEKALVKAGGLTALIQDRQQSVGMKEKRDLYEEPPF